MNSIIKFINNILSKYYGRMIICLFINQHYTKFIVTFGDFEIRIHFTNHTDTKIIKNIK